MKIIDKAQVQSVVVVDEYGVLLGLVTDGDIRRGILKGIAVTDAVEKVMNRSPMVAKVSDDRERILFLMKTKSLHQVPVLDPEGRLVRIEFIDDLLQPKAKDNWVVLMAGGVGKRLLPLTENCPKPLLKIGDRPILETIINNFSEHGFSKFFLTVNYKAEMVKACFGDGSRLGVQIQYVHENEPLGTAGALSLLEEKPKLPMIVMNGDLLTTVNFQQLLEFHTMQKVKATMCVREYDFRVPYGVVNINDHHILTIDEKPVQKFFVNAGIYVLEPEALQLIPQRQKFDMPSLFEALIAQKKPTAAFPLREYWVDIGHMEDFKKASGEFSQVFES